MTYSEALAVHVAQPQPRIDNLAQPLGTPAEASFPTALNLAAAPPLLPLSLTRLVSPLMTSYSSPWVPIRAYRFTDEDPLCLV